MSAGILRGVLDVKAGILELRLFGEGAVPVVVGVHPGQVEGVHGVLVFLQLDDVAVLVQHLDVQAQGLQLLHQHLEGLGHAGLGHVVALDDGLVGPDTAGDVVGLHRQDLLQGVGRAVGLQGPDFHLAEPLAAELGLAAQRLLGHQGVRAGGAGVDLVVHQVVQLQEVHVAHRNFVVKGLAGAAVVQHALALGIQAPPAAAAPGCRCRWAPSKMGVATFQPSFWAA